MSGKEICKQLKQIRRQIADANQIHLEIAQCTYEGDCAGTCPRCEDEMRRLREGLEAIRAAGGRIVIPRTEVHAPKSQEPDGLRVRMRSLQSDRFTQLSGAIAKPDWVVQPRSKEDQLKRRQQNERQEQMQNPQADPPADR